MFRYWAGLTYFRVAYLVFHDRINQTYAEMTKAGGRSSQIEWIITSFEFLSHEYPFLWDKGMPKKHDEPNAKFLQSLREFHALAVEYLTQLRARPDGQRIEFMDLLSTHLLHAPGSFGEALENCQKGRRREHHNTGDQHWRGEAMHCYFDYIPRHVDYLSTRGCKDKDLVFEAWCTMIFKGFLWQRYHNIAIMEDQDNGMVLPPKYYRSRMSVYMG